MTDRSAHIRFSPRPNRADLVHWRDWGPAAFAEAARDDKLIALFITAFWCGICQRLDETALSSDDVHLLLNAYFVPIRVEEGQRPDVDVRYSRDGWPTIVFFSPGGEPILTINGLETEQLIRLLVHLVDTHDKRRADFARPAEPIEQSPRRQPDLALLSHTTVDSVVSLLQRQEDSRDGGFGGPFKYFHVDALRFYLCLAERRDDDRFEAYVRLTLDTLLQRAIYDPADGAFFRYSSKPDWNEPHPEKLLLDQGSLLRLYLEAFDRTRTPAYQRTAERLIAYLETILGTADPPFFSGCQDYLRSPDGAEWTSVIDPYVYCDANAHAASAYFAAWRVLGRTDCRQRAERILDSLWDVLKASPTGMYHYFDGQAAHVPGLLIDSVATGSALLDGYDATGSARFAERAAQLGQDILRTQLDPHGGFFDISEPGPAALQRPLTELTQNAAAATFFLRLADACHDPRLRDAAQWALLGYGGSAEVYGAYAASFGHALDRYLAS